MEIDHEPAATQHKAELLLARGWGWLTGLLGKCMNKAVKVAKSTKKLGQDDPRRVIHSLKVGLALTLVSLIYYWRPLYDGFGVSGMWAVLTVVVVFEFTVGATLSKTLNRGFATFFAGALGLGAQHLASLFGERGQPIVLGILVFLLTAASSFTRFIPRIKARYDYGVLIFILTFSLVTVSGYRIEEILQLAHQRFSTILVGGATCIIVSIFVCPVWAGEDLHKLIASNLQKLANYLEGFGGENIEGVLVSDDDKALLQGYKSVLNSKSTEESSANFARWEPGHGRFQFRHPWKQYLKIGGLARKCAYHIEALNGYNINSHIQEPSEIQNKIRESSKKMSSESSKALKELALAIKTMADTSAANPHVENSKTAINDLKTALKAATLENVDVLAIIPIVSVASILIEITRCVEKISESVHELADLAHFKSVDHPTVSPEKPQLLHRGIVKPVLLEGDSDSDSDDHVLITVHENYVDSQENEVSQGPNTAQRQLQLLHRGTVKPVHLDGDSDDHDVITVHENNVDTRENEVSQAPNTAQRLV